MEGLIGSSSAHYIKGFHPPANLSPCKQPEFDVLCSMSGSKVSTPSFELGCKRPALAFYESEDVAHFGIAL